MSFDFTKVIPLEGERADHYVARLTEGVLSRAQVRRVLAEGLLRRGGRRLANGDKLHADDAARFEDCGLSALLEAGQAGPAATPGLPLDIVWEDEALVAVNKPAGMAVQPLRPDETGTVVNGLLARFPEMRDIGGEPLCPAVVHRIDIETSGLVLAARTGVAYRALRNEFRRFQVRKFYLAAVEGHAEAGRCDTPLTHATHVPCRMRLARPDEIAGRGERGQKRVFAASTAWRALKYDEERDQSLLEVEIRTGVTHQIRCHLAAAGHPLLGDPVYGRAKDGTGSGQALHSWKAMLAHPTKGELLTLEAPPPQEFPLG